jgi:hypothetical protein
MAVYAQDPNRLYLACGEYLGLWDTTDAALLASANRGANWTLTALPAGVKQYFQKIELSQLDYGR